MRKIRTSKRTHSKRKSLKRNNFYLKGGATTGKSNDIKYELLFRQILEFYDNEFKSVALESYSFENENIGFLTGGQEIRYYDYFEREFIENNNFDTYINKIQEKISKWNKCLNQETEVPEVSASTQVSKPEKLFIYSDSHGKYNDKYGTVPDNIVVCLLTRVGQYGYALNDVDGMKPILSIIDFNESEFETLFANKIKNTTEVFSNKINMWKNKIFNNCFQYSSWYYPGQKFDDLELDYTDTNIKSLGLYFFKTEDKYKEPSERRKIQNTDEFHEGDYFAYYKTKFGAKTLSELLEKLKTNFSNKSILITIECCRKLEKNNTSQKIIHADFYTQIINNYFINNQQIGDVTQQSDTPLNPIELKNPDIFKKEPEQAQKPSREEELSKLQTEINKATSLLHKNADGFNPEVADLTEIVGDLPPVIPDEIKKKLEQDIKTYINLKELTKHLNKLISYNNALGIVMKGLRDYSERTDYSTLNAIKDRIESIKTKIDSIKGTDSFNEQTKKNRTLRNARAIYNMFIQDTFSAELPKTPQDAKIKIARDGIKNIIVSTFIEELLNINPNLPTILNEANLNIKLKTFEDTIPLDTKVSLLKSNLNIFIEAIKPYMEDLSSNYEQKYNQVRKTLQDIILTKTDKEFYIKYDLPIRRIPFDGEKKLLKKLGANIEKLEIIDVFFYNGIPLRYNDDKNDIEMDISKIIDKLTDEYNFNKDLIEKIKKSDLPGNFYIKVKSQSGGDLAGLEKAYQHFFKKDEKDIKITQNQLLMNIKRDLIKKKDKLENETEMVVRYNETKGLFDILKQIYEGLAYSTSSLDGYEKDLKIMNPGGEFKTFYENQKIALNNLKNLIKIKIKIVTNDQPPPEERNLDFEKEVQLKDEYDLSIEPVKKDYIHETEFHNQDFFCRTNSTLKSYINKTDTMILYDPYYLKEYNPLANVFIIKFYNFVKNADLLNNPDEIINFVSNLKTSSIGQFSIFVHYMKRHYDFFNNQLFPIVENPKGTDDKSAYTNLFNIHVNMIFDFIFVKKLEKASDAKIEGVRDKETEDVRKNENKEIYYEIFFEKEPLLQFIKLYSNTYDTLKLDESGIRELAEAADAGAKAGAEAAEAGAEAGAKAGAKAGAEAGAEAVEKIYKYLNYNNYVYTYIFKQLVDNTDTLLENSIVKNNLWLIGNIDDINQNNIITNKILQLIKTFNKISYKFESFQSPKIKINRYQIRSSEDYGKLSEFSKQENIFKTDLIKTLDIYIPYDTDSVAKLKNIDNIETININSPGWEEYDYSAFNKLTNLNYKLDIDIDKTLDFSKIKKNLETLSINLFSNSLIDITCNNDKRLQELKLLFMHIKKLNVNCKKLTLFRCNTDKMVKAEGKFDELIINYVDIKAEKLNEFTTKSLKMNSCQISGGFEKLDFKQYENLELINVTCDNDSSLKFTNLNFNILESLTISGCNITCNLKELFEKFFSDTYEHKVDYSENKFLTVNLEITEYYDINPFLSDLRSKKESYLEKDRNNIIFNIMGNSVKADILYNFINNYHFKIIYNKTDDGTGESAV